LGLSTLVVENSYLNIFVYHQVLEKRLIAKFTAGSSLGISISPPDVLALCLQLGETQCESADADQ
jgi:hypothetical protein